MRLHEFNRWYAWYFTKLNWNYSPPTWSIQAQWSSGSWQLEVMERIGTSSCCWRCANEVHTHTYGVVFRNQIWLENFESCTLMGIHAHVGWELLAVHQIRIKFQNLVHFRKHLHELCLFKWLLLIFQTHSKLFVYKISQN